MAWFGATGGCGCCDCRIDLCKPCESMSDPAVHGIVAVEIEWFVDAMFYYSPVNCNEAWRKADGFVDGTFSGPATRTCGNGLAIIATVDGYPPGKIYDAVPGDPWVESSNAYHSFEIGIGYSELTSQFGKFFVRTRVFGESAPPPVVVYGEADQCDLVADLWPRGVWLPAGEGCSGATGPVGQARWRFECH